MSFYLKAYSSMAEEYVAARGTPEQPPQDDQAAMEEEEQSSPSGSNPPSDVEPKSELGFFAGLGGSSEKTNMSD